MPKDSVAGACVNVAQIGEKMYNVVAGSSRPERVLKDEVMRIRGCLPAKELDEVLGKVYVNLGSSERTGRVADYMKDLYGVGPRRLFVPKVAASRWRAGSVVKSLGTSLLDASLRILNPFPVDGMFPHAIVPFGGGKAEKEVSEPNKPSGKPSANDGSAGSTLEDVLNLKTIAKYCMERLKNADDFEVVYHMLLELLYRVDNEEWFKIKKKLEVRLIALEPRAARHVTVQSGNYVEKQIAHHVEKTAPAAPKKDGRKKPTQTGKIVDAVYTYKYIHQKEGKEKIGQLFQALVQLQWIDEATDPDDFMQLFSGKPKTFFIKWIGAKADLYALIKRLYDEKLISCPVGATVWVIARSHFIDKQSVACCNLNKQKMNKKTMPQIDYLLDWMMP